MRVWRIVGRIRAVYSEQERQAEAKKPYAQRRDFNRLTRWERRTVLLVAADFDTAAALAKDALVANWSAQPHEAEITSIAPTDAEVVHVR